jgi:hypothetical protein
MVGLSVGAIFFSSCTVFVFNDDEHAKKDCEDTLSIIITHSVEKDGQ